MVERTDGGPAGSAGQPCQVSAGIGACVYSVEPEDAGPLPTDWDGLQERVFARRSCHNANCHGPPESGELLLLEQSDEAVVGVMARSDACSNTGLALVDPGNPDGSLLYLKMAAAAPDSCGGDSTCGLPMPPTDAGPCEELEALRSWITNL